MVVAEFVQDRWRRIGILVLSVACAILAVSFGMLTDEEPFLPTGWPALFAASSVLLAAFAWRPSSHWLYRWSGSFVITAFASRPISTIARWSAGAVLPPRLAVSVVVYSLLAGAIGFIWLREVKPWQIRYQAGVNIRGD